MRSSVIKTPVITIALTFAVFFNNANAQCDQFLKPYVDYLITNTTNDTSIAQPFIRITIVLNTVFGFVQYGVGQLNLDKASSNFLKGEISIYTFQNDPVSISQWSTFRKTLHTRTVIIDTKTGKVTLAGENYNSFTGNPIDTIDPIQCDNDNMMMFGFGKNGTVRSYYVISLFKDNVKNYPPYKM